jgi:hypothetical protein
MNDDQVPVVALFGVGGYQNIAWRHTYESNGWSVLICICCRRQSDVTEFN